MHKNILNLFEELQLDSLKAEKVCIYTDFLLKANKKISLTSVVDLDSWFISQVEDCLRAYKTFSSLDCKVVFDCGSGNGLPGVIFSILSPSLKFFLCDRDVRKCEFLKLAAFKAKLMETTVVPGSVLDIQGEYSEDTCFIYRGLGPEDVLSKMFERHSSARHFRFKSKDQDCLFPGSKEVSYSLSDLSSRKIEIK